MLGNPFDRNDSIYSRNSCYKWDVDDHRWKRFKGHSGAKTIGKAELTKRMERIDSGQKVEFVSQNSFYYFLRKIFLKNKINPEAEGKEFRHSITNSIIDWCKELKTTREDLNIYASSRAYLYFRGERTAVSLRSIQSLALNGTDIIIIEKEDVAEVIQHYTNAAGIAILDTKGFAVQYARRLSKIAKEDGCNIAMITDLDADGILMTIKVKEEIPKLFRIGINFKMLKHFKINAQDAGESYSGKTMVALDKIHVDEDIATTEELEFMRNTRVEIDSVITEVDDNKKFAEYVINQLIKKFKTRDYNRAISINDYAYPTVLFKLLTVVKERSKPILEDKMEEIQADLTEYKGIIDDVEAKEKEFNAELIERLDLLMTVDPQGEQPNKILKAKEDFILLINKIQGLVDEFAPLGEQDEAET